MNAVHLLNECFDVLQLVQYGLEHQCQAKVSVRGKQRLMGKASPRLAYVALMMMISIPSMLSELLGVIFGGLKDDDDNNGMTCAFCCWLLLMFLQLVQYGLEHINVRS